MNPSDLQEITYLGDSVYAGHDGYQVWVWTDNGLGPNTPPGGIALEIAVIERLLRYVERMMKQAADP